MFHCQTTLGCVASTKTCDLSDDCCDFTDEQLPECKQFTKMSCEDTDQPFLRVVCTGQQAGAVPLVPGTREYGARGDGAPF